MMAKARSVAGVGAWVSCAIGRFYSSKASVQGRGPYWPRKQRVRGIGGRLSRARPGMLSSVCGGPGFCFRRLRDSLRRGAAVTVNYRFASFPGRTRMRAVVTGGSGFLGSHLCDRLLAEGWEVLGLDSLITGTEENLLHLEGNPEFK